jgi:NCAIR mutase (PurE)-related protein
MDEAKLLELLESVGAGLTSLPDAMAALRSLPFAELGYATVDHHRALRQGVPEVVFGQGKTSEQVIGIAEEIARGGGNVLITRLDEARAEALTARLPKFRFNTLARTATLEQQPVKLLAEGEVAIMSAGTGDLPVAEECFETLRMLGGKTVRIYDVGVAGIHRLLAKRETLERVAVAIVIAGMEGALPSAVGGLVSVPVIAVPTSVGYGASLGGFTALASMLTSCASGITVCNIDNGFGAAFAAARILRNRDRY